MPQVKRRLREDERVALIKSGSVFVFDELESGVKRWTDGLFWSPSRILNNFLVYRQIDKKSVPTPEETKAKGGTKEHIRFSASEGAPQVPIDGPHAFQNRAMMEAGPSDLRGSGLQGPLMGQVAGPSSGSMGGGEGAHDKDSDYDKALVGSLNTNFPFRRGGLCKKTISFPMGNSHQHLISYYNIDDVLLGRLRTPSSLPEISSLTISPPLLVKSNFRIPPQIAVIDGVPYYQGEPLETPQNPRRRSGAMSIGGMEEHNLSPSHVGRFSPYSPSSATGMTVAADDFRMHSQQQQPQHSHFAHYPPNTQFQHFGHFEQPPPGNPVFMSGAAESQGNRRRVVSDAPSRLAQIRGGGMRYEPYPSSNSIHSDGGHPAMVGGSSTGHGSSSDTHMSSPHNRRDVAMIGFGSNTSVDDRPQSARMYGEQQQQQQQHQNGFGTQMNQGWRNDAGYIPVTPSGNSAANSSNQSPREASFAGQLPPHLGAGAISTVPSQEFFQAQRTGQDAGPYYSHPHTMTGPHPHSRSQTRGTDWSADGTSGSNTVGSGSMLTGGSDPGVNATNTGGMAMHQMSSNVPPGATHPEQARLSGGSGGGGGGPTNVVHWGHMTQSGDQRPGTVPQSPQGPAGAGPWPQHGAAYLSSGGGAAGPHMGYMYATSSVTNSERSVGSWAQGVSDVPADALHMMQQQHMTTQQHQQQHQHGRPTNQSGRSSSISSEVSIPGAEAATTSIDWSYAQAGPGSGVGLKSPMTTEGSEGGSNGLARVMLRRPPSNG
ncbi:Global transcription regulator sge1 [Tilletia horrida]|uniref:Global transcription regulator sge1 n=1 Tax=Tilletia horrida TaxID=155126 RepID=A0AAN6JPX2_9BASI|nr:Global transcription regulator sge1 [Tilletia horrida]KAK0547036.1 Global transcription regulator sge1 [Tilletia horrida]KAK0562582.1 Global transcription regulator sge1 [Tilletia horrida]